MSGEGCSERQTAGLSGRPKMAQAWSVVRCRQRTPAGLLMPLTTGMPGMGDEIDGAMQHAPQPGLQSMGRLFGQAATEGDSHCASS